MNNDLRRKLLLAGILVGFYISIWFCMYHRFNADIIMNHFNKSINKLVTDLDSMAILPLDMIKRKRRADTLPQLNQRICLGVDTTCLEAEFFVSGCDALTDNRNSGELVFEEFETVCDLFAGLWTRFPKREVQGYITNGDKIIVTAVGNSYCVAGPKPILFKDQYFIAWPKDIDHQIIHKGMIERPGTSFRYIPVRAMFHSHVVAGGISEMDFDVARKFPLLKHLVIERNKIISFNRYGIRHISRGNFRSMCELLHN